MGITFFFKRSVGGCMAWTTFRVYFVLSPAGAGLILLLVCNQNIRGEEQHFAANRAGRPDLLQNAALNHRLALVNL